MKVLHNNVLVTQDKAKESTTASGLIISSAKPTGQTPAKVISMSIEVASKNTIAAGNTVYFDWSKAIAVELDGIQCAVIDYNDIKLIVD
jgi:co-chaperonin GroES (HSP10)|tara:strand:- start:99 stop:365 length:267 start_codon:yes stop_codon:yes gene_type:complete